MDLSSRQIGDTLVVRVPEARIDALVAIQFKDSMRTAVPDRTPSASGPGRVILDLEKVAFVDSSGLGAIVATMKFLAPERRLELAALQPNVARVFRLTRMDGVFVIHEAAPSDDTQGGA